jgi:hypothetical protein
VTFAGQPALVLKASPTELTVVAPAAAAGRYPTRAARRGDGRRAGVDERTELRPTRGSTAGFVPLFFAAPVTEFPGSGYVFVSTEIGPVLLFGSPAGAASTADRAVAAASALNALVNGAQSKPPAFELRGQPQPGVGVVGDVRTFLVPTPEDAEAYSKNWETGRGAGRRIAPPALARHWARCCRTTSACSCTGSGRSSSPRSRRAARSSPRSTARRTAATRRPGADERRADERACPPALRQAALVVSGEAGPGGRGGRRPLGRDDGGSGPRQAAVHRPAAQRQAASSRERSPAWRGSVELRSPLREIGFDQGNVRFTATCRARRFRFKGRSRTTP